MDDTLYIQVGIFLAKPIVFMHTAIIIIYMERSVKEISYIGLVLCVKVHCSIFQRVHSGKRKLSFNKLFIESVNYCLLEHKIPKLPGEAVTQT